MAGEFNKKTRDADLHICTTEPSTPWMNRAEIREKKDKKVVAWKMIKKQSLKVLWEVCT